MNISSVFIISFVVGVIVGATNIKPTWAKVLLGGLLGGITAAVYQTLTR